MSKNSIADSKIAETSNVENGIFQQLKQIKSILVSFWNSQQRNLFISAIIAAVVAGIIVASLWGASDSYRPLYGSGERYENSEIINILDSESIKYQLDNGTGQVLVNENDMSQIRMLLAAKGVKAKLPTGLENLDNTSSLGTSQFIENARYRHGLEGELAKTIMGLTMVSNARVHLAIPKESLFVRQTAETPSASVMVQLKAGKELKPEQVEAIVNLVSGSVNRLNKTNVSVVDQYGRLLNSDIDNGSFSKMSTKYINYQKKIEKEVIRRASDMLLPILGASNFRVQTTANLNFNNMEETKEQIDPNSVVQTEQSINDNSIDKIALGIPGSLSNKPPTIKNEKQTDNKNTSERNEINRQYALGKKVTFTKYQQGKINDLNVAVLLNSKSAPDGKAWTAIQIDNLKKMVSEAVGISSERGDTINIQTFPFTAMTLPEEPNIPWWQDSSIHKPMRYMIGGILSLAMIFFVLKPLVRHLTHVDRNTGKEIEFAEEYSADLQTREEITKQKEMESRLKEQGIDIDKPNRFLPPVGSPLEVQLQHLTLISKEEPQKVAEVLKQWIKGNE